MKISEYIEKYEKEKDKRGLADFNKIGLSELSVNLTEDTFTRVEDLFGNLYQGIKGSLYNLENFDLSDEDKDKMRMEIANSVTKILSIQELFSKFRKDERKKVEK